MDVNSLRAILTLACFLMFLAIVGWAWSGASRKRFDEAARLPLEDDQCLEPHALHSDVKEARL